MRSGRVGCGGPWKSNNSFNMNIYKFSNFWILKLIVRNGLTVQ
jgi:hypothetical protein